MENMDDIIFIDTGSSVNTIKNWLLLGRIRVSNRPIPMQTNAGSTRIDLEGNFFGLGVMYWDEDLQVNIVCFADLILRYRITYDSEIEDAFYVHMDTGILYATENFMDTRSAKNIWKQWPSPRATTDQPSNPRLNTVTRHLR